jgi:hypothetical protein
VTLLGAAAPQTATFFLTFITLRALLTVPLTLIRLIPLIVYTIKSKLAATERARERLWRNQFFP